MADFTFLPPAGSDPNAPYPSVLGQPAVGGPIIYPETQPNDPPAESDFTRETGLDPSKIPSLDKLLRKRPPLRMLQGGAADSVDAGDLGPVANAESEKTGGAPANALVVANTAQEQSQVSQTQTPSQTLAPPGTIPNSNQQQPKAGMPWWQIALVAGGALLVGYSIAKRRSDSPLVADMEDEEGEEEDED